MSLGQPDLYIAGRKMQTLKADPLPALAGLQISWGSDEDYDMAPASTLSGQLLVKGSMPAYLEVGAPVGLVDPVSSRTLFAGTLEPLKASPEKSIAGAHRLTFTAASPKSELEKHRVLDIDWTHNEPATVRRQRLAAAMPRGWSLDGAAGWDWINQGRQLYQSIDWITLAERYARSYYQRLHDTSTYVPGAGVRKRLTITNDRPRAVSFGPPEPGPLGVWQQAAGSSGVAVLPASAVGKEIEWEKTPADVITDVQITSYGAAYPQGAESTEFEYWMSVYVNNDALQDRYGYRQQRVETALSSYNTAAAGNAIKALVGYWLNTQTDWRPTTLSLVDSRRLATAPLLNLLAVDTRHMAILRVPGAVNYLAGISAYVLAGTATWTGKKWTADLTLGRKL